MSRFIPVIALTLLATATGAQEPGRTYQVEVVVFEQSGATAEVLFFQEPELAPEAGADPDALVEEAGSSLPEPSPGALVAAEAAPKEEEEGPVLPEGFGGPIDELQMEALIERLDAGGYRVLWHQAWTQPAGEREQDQAVPLAVLAALGGGEAAPELSGSVELAAGRYLHLGLDLSVPADGEATYTLARSRRVKINDLHYFDHPRLGAITLVTVPEAQPGAEDAPEAPPP
jgi:hypothetical protein